LLAFRERFSFYYAILWLLLNNEGHRIFGYLEVELSSQVFIFDISDDHHLLLHGLSFSFVLTKAKSLSNNLINLSGTRFSGFRADFPPRLTAILSIW
jgi:hypothetical protein